MAPFFHRVAGNLDALDVFQYRAFGSAALIGQGAAWVETATGWRVEWIGYLALHRRTRTASVFHFGNGIEQHARVGMLRVAEQAVLVGQFHQLPQIHHPHVVAHVPHHRQVVRDEQIGEAALALQIFHDVQHLRLNTDIQGGSGFIADQKLWRCGQCTCNGNALALSTRELMGVLHHVER